MDELTKLVAQKTGISEAVAKTAVETIVGFLTDKLPAPIAGQIDSVISGDGLAEGAEGILGGVGGSAGQQG